MKVFSLEIFPLYGIYLFLFADLDYDSNTKLREVPLPFEIPLPMECTVAGTNARSYNQGQCSRKLPQGSVHNRGNTYHVNDVWWTRGAPVDVWEALPINQLVCNKR